jgi:class 3 adenylate cyclase/HD superfamily phosphodiesterase
VLFSDFVDFSNKSKHLNPLRLLKKLEYYFTQFDEIMKRYHLEKIKTIGDAYMAIAGVTETTKEPVIRACLAALEIRDFMRNEHDVARAMNKDAWEIRIGLHMGPLVAGIIGSNKISFDVWGDTVNIAARCESVSLPGCITITEKVAQTVQDVFNLEERGKVDILKRGGNMHMYFLKDIKLEHCLYGEGKIASTSLRMRCGLSSIDFSHMRKFILNKLKAHLPEEILYHDVAHVLNVEKAAVRYALLEGLDEHEMLLLQTAVLYHDAGFMIQYDNNEEYAIQLAKSTLPTFGYLEEHIDTITSIIQSTSQHSKPQNILEEIMCDADHDYLGRPDYLAIVKKLREELANYGTTMSNEEWLNYQIHYLENIHFYYTSTAQNIRLQGKKARIAELKSALNALNELT